LPAPIHRDLTYHEQIGIMYLADGVPEVLKRTRENLMKGASQIKIVAGGSVTGNYDPIDVREFSLEEMKAAVDAAEGWKTYVMAHVYNPTAIKMAIKAGIRSIEHGQLIDEETAKLMAEKGVWLSLQPFLDDEDAIPLPKGSPNRAKQLQVTKGTDNAYALAKKYNLKVAWGTDVLFSPELAKKQGKQLAKLVRWYKPWEVLKMATSTNYELLKMSGPRDPYPGENGVIVEGAYADMILVEGNPLENINLIADPEKNFKMIMKDGKIYKNTLL